MKIVRKAKQDLVDNIIFRLSINGAFQRNNIYCERLNSRESKEFKNYLKNLLQETFESILSNSKYSENDHYRTIKKFSNKVSRDNSGCLANQTLNIGTSQKLINLYWKALWLFKNVRTPIHCPFDGVIIRTLSSDIRDIKWTRINDINEYKRLVKAAKEKSRGQNLAEWELITYNQQNLGF